MLLTLLAPAVGGASAGCRGATLPPAQIPAARQVGEIGTGEFEPRVQAFVVPPQGWALEPQASDDRHTHLLWISPTRDTAYGVIFFRLPIYGFANAMTHSIALDQIGREMARDQGDATILSREWDGDERLMRYEADAGRFRLDALLRVRGWVGWAVYVGKRRDVRDNPEEIAVALEARDATRVGRDVGGVDAEFPAEPIP